MGRKAKRIWEIALVVFLVIFCVVSFYGGKNLGWGEGNRNAEEFFLSMHKGRVDLMNTRINDYNAAMERAGMLGRKTDTKDALIADIVKLVSRDPRRPPSYR